MSEITPNPNLSEINYFKNEIYGQIRELEKKLNLKINNAENKITNEFESFSTRINTLMEKNKEMVVSVIDSKLKLDKITELEKFKSKVEGMVLTHDLRIKNNMDDILQMKLKYDRIISDNLYVSGFIGPTCQFKTLSEYLSYNISEFSRVKMEKDQLKKDTKDFKTKLDALTKNMVALNDKSVQLCNQYTDNKLKEFQIILDNTSNDLNERTLNMRGMILKIQEKAEEDEKRHQEEFNKLVNMKGEFINLIENKFIEMKKYIDECNQKILNNSDNININKKKIEEINGQIKDLYQKNKDLIFQIRNYYFPSSKLSNSLEKMKGSPSKINYQTIKNEIYSPQKVVSPKKLMGRRRSIETRSIRPTLEEIQPFTNLGNISSEKEKEKEKDKKIFDRIYSSNANINSNNTNNTNNTNNINNANNTNNNKNNKIDDYSSYSESSISENKIISNNNDKKINKTIDSKKSIEEYSIINKNKKSKININLNLKNIKNKSKMVDKLTNTLRAESSRLKSNLQKNDILPSLIAINNKEENQEDLKKINSSAVISRSKNLNKKNKKDKNMLSNDEKNKIINQKKEILYRNDYLINQDKQACKIVTLSLPQYSSGDIERKKKMIKDKVKYDMVNSLINSYRSKLFSKAHSPEEKLEIANEILEIPKKVTQAFGRTAYTFYFKKETLNALNPKKKVNNFTYSSLSKRHLKEMKNINKTETENENKK